ncbi:metal dependent phosphohydrolase [Tokyovirus A1]|uniref:metal dependent phosphohydrolase n=1 Tax=Tokyovirus A1 TaxID=1826170 RepID=UPI0007A98EE9|nr:metal dependent phosphohydrolase [Tokyovirus A1]BAU79997.1 metal dependent phosphohydrolase [Tokyovirus A1]
MDRAVAIAKPIMSTQDVTHDWMHVLRVLAHARKIMEETSLTFDREVVEIGCVLHDIADHKYASRVDLEEALSSLCLDEQKTGKIRQIIQRTSWSVQKKEGDVPVFEELRIVRDADKLDAVCEEGVLRAFGTAAIRGTPMFVPSTPSHREWKENGERVLDEDGSLIGHFYAKLFHLRDFFYFDASEEMALPHRKRLEEFVKRMEVFRK